jgi:molybdopterin-guanine dinucleotide biosynthesis protein A
MILSSVRSGVSAAILAGGRARRLGGADKAALIVGGLRIIDRQLAVLTAVAEDLLIIANDRPRYAAFQLPVFPDAVPGAGALGGVYTALQAARCDLVLVVACDLPFVTRALLERLIDEADEAVDAVIPRTARGLEPLCAAYRKRTAPIVRARIDRGALRVSELPRDLRVRELGPAELEAYNPDGRLFENVNTPHDYARARTLVEGNREPPEDRITE